MIQIATYNDALRAHFVRSLLEDFEIVVELRDEHLVQVDPLLSGAVGGVKVLVLATQVDQALEIIAEEQEHTLDSGLRCPECGNRTIQFSQLFHTWAGLTILLFFLPLFSPAEGVLGLLRTYGAWLWIALFFLGIGMVAFQKFPLKCSECGHTGKRSVFEPTMEELDDVF